MHRTTRGIVVTRVAINNETFEELKSHTMELNMDVKKYNETIRIILNSWAKERIEQRNKANEHDEFLGKMRFGSPPTT